MDIRHRCLVLLLLSALLNACGDAPNSRPSAPEGDDAPSEASPLRPGAPELTPTASPNASSRAESSPLVAPPDTSFLVFGFVRPDGVVEPTLVRGGDGWGEVMTMDAGRPVPEPGIWAQATTYVTRDSVGTESTLSAGNPVRICCGTNGNEFWAHSTDRSGENVERYSFGRRGYAFSTPISNAAFLQTSSMRRAVVADSVTHDSFSPTARRPTLDHVLTLLDSLAPIPDSVLPLPDSLAPIIEIDVWEAGLESEQHAYVQATQIRRWQQYDWCFRVVGWLDPNNPPNVHVTSSGSDDCDGKGHGTHTPVTLFRQTDGVYMILAIHQYSDSPIQLWRHSFGTEWLPVTLSNVTN